MSLFEHCFVENVECIVPVGPENVPDLRLVDFTHARHCRYFRVVEIIHGKDAERRIHLFVYFLQDNADDFRQFQRQHELS